MALSDKLSKYEGLKERFPQAQMSGYTWLEEQRRRTRIEMNEAELKTYLKNARQTSLDGDPHGRKVLLREIISWMRASQEECQIGVHCPLR